MADSLADRIDLALQEYNPLSKLTSFVRRSRLDVANAVSPAQAERVRQAVQAEIKRYRSIGYSEKEINEAII